jgi:hypothetical protein
MKHVEGEGVSFIHGREDIYSKTRKGDIPIRNRKIYYNIKDRPFHSVPS